MKCGVTRPSRRRWLHVLLFGSLLISAAACNSCRPSKNAETQKPTLRLYLVSNMAGALEPCGCVKDQLGGLDHVAALMTQEKKNAPDAAFVAAGPTFFLDPSIK